VINRLRSLRFAVIEVNFGGKPFNEMYANKRSEMWDAMAKWLRAGGVIPNHGELKPSCVPGYFRDSPVRASILSRCQ
jgi:hypothetical protein